MPAQRRISVARLWCAMVLAAAPSVAVAVDPVGIILSERGGAYAEVAEVLRSELEGIAETRSWLASDRDGAKGVRLAAGVAIGTAACERLAQSDLAPAMLCVLLPKAAFERIAGASGRRLSAIVLDQPLARQLVLIRIALPGRSRVAVLFGPQSKALGADLLRAAGASDLRIVAVDVDSADNLGPALQHALVQADVLLGTPDAVVFNSQTIQNILGTSFRMHVPLVAFSPAYVRAGALIAVYSTPAQIGRQAAQALSAMLSGRTLPALQYPQEFAVTTNRYVARSLGIDLPGEAALQEMLQAEQHLAESRR